jgi:hypothetical protein
VLALPYSSLKSASTLFSLETRSVDLLLGGFLPFSTHIFATCFAEVLSRVCTLVCEVVWVDI